MTPADFYSTLSSYVPSDSVEAEHQRQILRLLETASAPFSRDSFIPGHITGSAFVISRTGHKALLLQHKKLNRWLQPGGHVEADDDGPASAAQREAQEETGLNDLKVHNLFDVDVHTIPARRSEPEHLHFDVRYLLIVEDLPSLEGAETEARWFSVEELAAVDIDGGLTRMVKKAQKGGWI